MSIHSWTWHNIYSDKVAKVKGSLAIYTAVQVPSESNNTLLLLYSLITVKTVSVDYMTSNCQNVIFLQY